MKQAQNEKENSSERLKQILEVFGLSTRKFAQRIGLQPNSGNKVINGQTRLTQSLAYAIELRFGYCAEWLLTGKGAKKANPRRFLSLEENTMLDVVSPDTITQFFKKNLRERRIRLMEQRRFRIEEALFFFRGRDEGSETVKTVFQRDEEKREKTLQNFEVQMKQREKEVIQRLFPNPVTQQNTPLTQDEGREAQLTLYAQQAFMDTIAQALFFGEEWEALKERSKAYQSLQDTFTQKRFSSLKADFEATLKQFQALAKDCDSLFSLNEEEEAILRAMELERLRSIQALHREEGGDLLGLEKE